MSDVGGVSVLERELEDAVKHWLLEPSILSISYTDGRYALARCFVKQGESALLHREALPPQQPFPIPLLSQCRAAHLRDNARQWYIFPSLMLCLAAQG